jgi:hypothetical protein
VTGDILGRYRRSQNLWQSFVFLFGPCVLTLSLFSSPFFVISSQRLRNGCMRNCVSFPGPALNPAQRPAQWATKTVTQGENGPDHEADNSPQTIRMIGAIPPLPLMSARRAQKPLAFSFPSLPDDR